MSDAGVRIAGGCLCGALRYVASREPALMGLCYCQDCRKASGSGFVPFMGFAANALHFTGETRQSRAPAFRGGEAVRNTCAVCGGLVFGGIVGVDVTHTIYAGSLDDPTQFRPSIAIFVRSRAPWALLPPNLKPFDTLPD
ncbi:MAG TPA: GFA family protein [Hyphomonadaceae bacterium]|nr:GFA family protein [Hyphomonadaceae bacterium]